jgi:ATP-binding cassette subfamily B protein/ATP-binding cassette subfamily C protein/ATP-binding cassette subfamily B multidrug efflux pump
MQTAHPTTLTQLITAFVRRNAWAYASSAVMLLGIALLTVWLPHQVGQVVDGLVARRLGPATLAQELGKMVAAGVAIYGLRVAWRLRLYATAYQLGVELRERLFAQLTHQGPAFYQQQRTGGLMALATNDIDAVEMAAGEALLAAFDGTLTFVLVLATMVTVVDARLAAVALLPFPVMAWAFWWISRHVHEASRLALNRFGTLNDRVQETVTGVRTLRSLGLVQASSARFSTLAGEAADASLQAQRWEAAYEPAVGGAMTTASVAVLGYGGWLVWDGGLTLGELTSFGLYLGQLIWPMFAAGWVLSLLERGRAAWGRLQPILYAAPSISDDGRHDAPPKGAIEGQGLSLTYPGQTTPALLGVDVTLPPGTTLGLVGPTGAGKSSLLALLLRHWPPSAGTLRWGGVDWAGHGLESLRGHIAWVPQEPFLFSTSVAENIALAKPHATRSEVEAVARLAAVDEDIARLPQGYDTVVGERGVTLSGGQRQRVAIARALLADAPLLLLDDALSAVDAETERRILTALRQARQGRSVVIVSHRLSAVADAEQVLVLKHGQVVERGTHAALKDSGGWYGAQWRLQQMTVQIGDELVDEEALDDAT